MIYETVSTDDPITQGDIFRNIPRVDLSFRALAIVEGETDEEIRQKTWSDALADGAISGPVSAVLPIKPVTAIVITQNCDAARCDYLCLCEIGEFLTVSGRTSSVPKDPKGWKELIVNSSRQQPRVFYLPANPAIGFKERQGVDFRIVLRISRIDIEGFREHRIGKLNKVANEHFREALSFFFRRYAYNEWYPLTSQEFELYKGNFKDEVERANILPYYWQQPEPDPEKK